MNATRNPQNRGAAKGARCGLEIGGSRGWDARMIQLVRVLMVMGVLLVSLRADSADNLVRIHVEACGGRAAVDALKAIKATGITRNESGEFRFILWAARPNRIRTEVTSGERTIAQGWDGSGEPWTADSQSRRITLLRGTQADEFKSDAQYDNPLLAGPEQVVSLDYAGKVELEGEVLIKVIAVQNFTALSYVYLDPATYLLVRRDIVRRRGSGTVTVRTDYSDFRAVAGVLLPHRMVVSIGNRRMNETLIKHIEPNPRLEPTLFAVQLPRE